MIRSDILKAIIPVISDKLVVSAVGAESDHDAVVKQCEALFKDAPRGAVASVPEKPYFCGAWMNYQNEEMGLS